MPQKNDSGDGNMMLAAAAAAMAAGVVCMKVCETRFLSPASSETTDSSSSLDSTGRTIRSRKRRRVLADQVHNISSSIGEIAEAIKSRRKDIASTLYSEIMKSEGYDEFSLCEAFGYLLEHENLAKAFLAKSNTLRQAWLSRFFSRNNIKGKLTGEQIDKISQAPPPGVAEELIEPVDADARGNISSAAETSLFDDYAADDPESSLPLTMLPTDAPSL